MLSIIFPFISPVILFTIIICLMIYLAKKNVVFYAFSLLFFGGPILNTLYLRQGINTGDILGIISSFVFIVIFLKYRRSLGPVHVMLICFFSMSLVNIAIFQELRVLTDRNFTSLLFYEALPVAILSCSLSDFKNIRSLFNLLILFGILMCVFSLVAHAHYYGGDIRLIGVRFGEQVPNFTHMGNSEWFSLAGLSALAMYSLLENKREALFLLFVFFFFCLCIVLSGTRSTVLSFMVSLFVFSWISLKSGYRWKPIVTALLLVLVVILCSTESGKNLLRIESWNFVMRISGASDLAALWELIATSRGYIWVEALKSFESAPVFGVGLGNWGFEEFGSAVIFSGHDWFRRTILRSTNPENIPLTMLVETGVVGFFLFVGLLVLAGRFLVNANRAFLYRSKEGNALVAFTYALFCGSLIRMQFYGVLIGAFDLFIAIALISNLHRLLALTESVNRKSQESNSNIGLAPNFR